MVKMVFVFAALVFVVLIVAYASASLSSFGKIVRKQGVLAGMLAVSSAAPLARGQKGFTLIELLVVIAIIAILSVVVILTLSPAELVKQARDSNRISDLNMIKSAISLFLADTASSSVGLYANCYVDVQGANGTTTCGFAFNAGATAVASSATPRAVDSTGWIPIRFTAISSGAPFGNLPVDPLDNDKIHFYAYHASSTVSSFKLAANMESVKYSAGGSKDVVGPDGGPKTTVYEVGTDLSL